MSHPLSTSDRLPSDVALHPTAAAAETPADPRPPAPAQRYPLVRLMAVVVAVVIAAVATRTTAVLIVVTALVVMVMLHELGHLLAAKWSRMKVTEYFLGFGPRLWSVRRGETEYGVKAIPAGGYVKIIGMTSADEVDPADEPRTYRQRPFHNRLVVALAGSAMHFVMAFVLLWGLFVFIGWPQANAVAVTGFVPVSHGVDPARAAGIEPGDVVVSVGGVPVHSPQELQRLISTRARQPVTVVVERGGQSRAVVVTPQADPALHGANGRIGVEIGPPVARSNPGIALGRSSHLLGQFVTGSFSAMGHVFSASGISSYLHDLTNAHAANQAAHSGDRISSIYGAARLAVQGAQAGAAQLILVLVTIIVFVGILNLFPMLPLDGGHVLIAVYEKIRSRRGRLYHADVTKLMPVAYAFVLLLGFIVVSSLYLDITHPIVNRFQ